MSRRRYRCPICRVIAWAADTRCAGGWPIHDPARPNSYDAEHPPTRVVPDPDGP